MNPLQRAFAQDDETRRLFNQAVESLARDTGRGFDDCYRDLEQVLNSLSAYMIEEEP